MNSLEKGTNNIVWDGKDEGGNVTPAGDYTYYIWGFDNVNPRIQVTKSFQLNPWNQRTIVTHDVEGNPLAQPILYSGDGVRNASTTAPIAHTNKRWVVGNDPEDASLLQTCRNMQMWCVGGLAFDPKNPTKFFKGYQVTGGVEIKRMTWVPNGDAVSDSDDLKWGDEGRYFFNSTHSSRGFWGPGVVSDGKDYLFCANADGLAASTTISELIFIDVNDGTEIKRLDLAEWWVDINDGQAGAQNTGGPSEINFKHDIIAMGSHSTCVNQAINPYYEDEADAILWTNTNGDYVGDHNWEPTSTKKWVCNDYNVGPYKYCTVMDDNLFVAFPSFDMGAVSFGLYAPDGTGVGYLALAGETAYQKHGIEFIDYGSPYDGIYTTSNVGRTTAGVDASTWYVGQDSIKGVITNQTGVKDSAPASFMVAQNAPNPFNPTTTISFTLAKAGKTTIDVFNAAGQKVDTILNANLSAGSHSVTWNAANRSAGVYFYTVRSGDFSRTMKMTLLK
jgi:hypothetical protein